jgi:hypothetical protein
MRSDAYIVCDGTHSIQESIYVQRFLIVRVPVRPPAHPTVSRGDVRRSLQGYARLRGQVGQIPMFRRNLLYNYRSYIDAKRNVHKPIVNCLISIISAKQMIIFIINIIIMVVNYACGEQ